MITPPYRPLKMSSGWVTTRNKFYDLSPDAEPKFKSLPHDDGWFLFEQELLVFSYPKLDYCLDMGWVPKSISEDEHSIADGNYYLQIVQREGWETLEKLYEGRSLEGITAAINQAMLKMSLKNNEYSSYPEHLQLQNLRPFGGWRFVKNELFDIEPSDKLDTEQWKLFTNNLLYLEDHNDTKIKIEMGWFPAFKPSGEYRAKLINENLENPLLEEFSTKNKDEIAEYINQAMAEKVNLLKQKRKK